MSCIFPTAAELRNDGRNYLIILNEVRSIENSILFASDSGLMDVQVYNTYMTNITLESYQNVTTVTTSTDTFTKNSHGLQSGDEIQFATTGLLPAPLLLGRNYFVIVTDINNFKVADTFLDTVNNVPIDITTIGTGTHSFRHITPAQKYYETWQGTEVDRPRIQQMNAVISHFVNDGYQIKRITNPDTNLTFRWVIAW